MIRTVISVIFYQEKSLILKKTVTFYGIQVEKFNQKLSTKKLLINSVKLIFQFSEEYSSMIDEERLCILFILELF